nr:hypothetical protein [Comamonas jiangduensis]
MTFGGQQWSEWLPPDRKPWSVALYWPDEQGSALPPLSWDDMDLLQRMEMDTPALERLHDGRSLSCVMSELYAPSKHRDDGRLLLKKYQCANFCGAAICTSCTLDGTKCACGRSVFNLESGA